MIMMTQTRIDQFYKVSSSGNKSAKVKNNIKMSSRSPVLGKTKRGQALEKSRTSITANTGKASLSKANVNNSPMKIMENRMLTSPTAKHTSPIKSQQRTPESRSGTKFTPKTSSPIKDALDRSPERAKMVRRKLFKERTEKLVSTMINNLNLAKEGAIANNNIDLEKAYSSKIFNYRYNPIDTTASTRYEINDVVIPTDMYSLHFFLAIVIVFSNPINCGYFDRDELDLIFSLITLRKSAQALLIRMLKKKHTWHRVSNIKYDEISTDLKPIFDELVSRSIFKSNTQEEDISVLLNLLQADEIRKLCQESKINASGKKNGIQSILTFCRKTKSLFPGMATPATKLRALVNKRLGDCISLNVRIKELIDRIIVLLVPNRDPAETLVDVFLTLLRVETDQIKFPEITISDFPIFANKEHLLDYIEAKNTLTNLLSAIEEKKWETVRNLGTLAAQRLQLVVDVESDCIQDSSLPHYIRHFMPSYLWLKILSKSIDAFKKTIETIPLAIEFLQMLINQNCHMKYRKGQWYSELIKIEMHHRKNFDASVALLSDAITYENLTEVDRLDLKDRAERIANRKSGISKSTKDSVKLMLDNMFSNIQLTPSSSITINGSLCGRNTSHGKSNWCISSNTDQQMYGSVESLALYYYKGEGYIKGMHCEGAFPITLFATLFWDEIYNMNIPGAWVSLYQYAPLDLYSSEFYENRKEQIDMKLQIIRKFDSETLSRHLKHEFEMHCEYASIIQANIFKDSNCFQEVAFCLGVEGVVGICKRLIHNFSLWRAGFPDLIVWNANTKQYKIVEVKGPNDTLSTKQKLWLDYLNRLGLNTEVCYCESNTSQGRKRKHDEIVI
ncbi:fanconi-associated nuclease 1 [Solenopsis invicta]|uniref:fanconi-associated nuclease 1 n=1 Tax=Solenopsis invicta TaxID=13686 RepID=UPI000595F131|nr:fanconi-associated nuclease 1 [Solenopsis invicta]XP_039306169.1 fanconi-associated nuclease 1 [Solenopsis invicta]